MLTTLIVSRPRTKGAWRRQVGGLTFSMAAHAVVFYAAAMATMPGATGGSAVTNDTSLIYVRPQERKPLEPPPPIRPETFRTLVAPIDIPASIPPIDFTQTFDPGDYTGVGVERGPAQGVERSVDPTRVFIESVVDEPVSIRVVSSTNRAFESAARDALRRALFRAGRVQGQRVRVLVHQPLKFQLPK